MSVLSGLRGKAAEAAKAWPFQTLPPMNSSTRAPTHREANPAVIRSALVRAQRRPAGNWYAFAASSRIAAKAWGTSVAGVEIVAWRGAEGGLLVAPRACPHLGADLSSAPVECGTLVCPWHGLRLSDRRYGEWEPFPSHDDGVLCWVRLDTVGGETPTETPILSPRPGNPRLAVVSRLEGVCEPGDIVANRLDPWHGAWFHPYAFTRLEVLNAPAADDELPDELDRFLVAVTFRIGRLGVPVIAEFYAPGPRTVVMRIIDGDGQGSVVETHCTPVGDGRDGLPRTAVVEAVIAHSDRPHFGKALVAAPVIRPLMRWSATRLWRDDLAYAERLFELRS
jgi:Domain of unknown function (DUF5914)/Rieske [2Fe-2S] domain